MVDSPDDVVSQLKYATCKHIAAAAKAGGTSSYCYHVYVCPELGVGRVATMRIPCACVACDNMIRCPWEVGTLAKEQPRFSTVTNCNYCKVLGV